MTLNSLKKIIKYRSNYSGTKETDILYKKYFINNLNRFSENELKYYQIVVTDLWELKSSSNIQSGDSYSKIIFTKNTEHGGTWDIDLYSMYSI